MRVESDLGPDPIKAKIGEAERAPVHTMLVIDARDVDTANVSVRLHSKGPQGATNAHCPAHRIFPRRLKPVTSLADSPGQARAF